MLQGCKGFGFGVYGLGFRDEGVGLQFWVWGYGFKFGFGGLRLRVWGSGFGFGVTDLSLGLFRLKGILRASSRESLGCGPLL